MFKILYSSLLIVFVLSCGSTTDKKKGTTLTTDELEGAKYIRDCFKGMNELSESSFGLIEALNPNDFVQNKDTFIFESISFDWPGQFEKSMISAYYETPAEMGGQIIYSASKMMNKLGVYLQTDQELEDYSFTAKERSKYVFTESVKQWISITNFCFVSANIIEPVVTAENVYKPGFINGQVYFIDQNHKPLGKVMVEATSSPELEYNTPNYDEDLHLSSSLRVDLNRNFIKQVEIKIQELLNTDKIVRFKNEIAGE